jgi:hypothetical protein
MKNNLRSYITADKTLEKM